jgi:hypothetical protein
MAAGYKVFHAIKPSEVDSVKKEVAAFVEKVFSGCGTVLSISEATTGEWGVQRDITVWYVTPR